MNIVIISGNLTRDPEVNYTQGAEPKAITTMTVASSRGKKTDGTDAGADYIRTKVFGKQAENCKQYLKQGSKVLVQGKWQTGSYEDKDGKKVYTNDLVASRVEFLDKKKDDESTQPSEPKTATPEGFESIEEDVPF